MPKKEPPFKRLYANYKENEKGCWVWQGQTGKTSLYGQIKAFGKFVLTHRLSYELYNGKIPDGSVRYWVKTNNPKAKLISKQEYFNE